jgi:transketolase
LPMKRVGILDVFGESGEGEELLRKYGLTADKVVEAAEDVIRRR